MENLKGLLSTRRMEKAPNAGIKEFCRVKKGLDERIDEGVFRWFGDVERIVKSVNVGECGGSRSVVRPRKR